MSLAKEIDLHSYLERPDARAVISVLSQRGGKWVRYRDIKNALIKPTGRRKDKLIKHLRQDLHHFKNSTELERVLRKLRLAGVIKRQKENEDVNKSPSYYRMARGFKTYPIKSYHIQAIRDASNDAIYSGGISTLYGYKEKLNERERKRINNVLRAIEESLANLQAIHLEQIGNCWYEIMSSLVKYEPHKDIKRILKNECILKKLMPHAIYYPQVSKEEYIQHQLATLHNAIQRKISLSFLDEDIERIMELLCQGAEILGKEDVIQPRIVITNTLAEFGPLPYAKSLWDAQVNKPKSSKAESYTFSGVPDNHEK